MEPINEKKNLFIDAFNKKNPASINKKMLNGSKVAEISKVKHITPETKHTTST